MKTYLAPIAIGCIAAESVTLIEEDYAKMTLEYDV